MLLLALGAHMDNQSYHIYKNLWFQSQDYGLNKEYKDGAMTLLGNIHRWYYLGTITDGRVQRTIISCLVNTYIHTYIHAMTSGLVTHIEKNVAISAKGRKTEKSKAAN